MKMRSKDLDSTSPELSELWTYIVTEHQHVLCLEGKYHYSICLQDLVKMMEETEKAIIKEKNEIVERTKQVKQLDKILEGMQKKINEFLGVQSLTLVEFSQQGEKVDDSYNQQLAMVKQIQKSMTGYLRKMYSCTRNFLWLFGNPLKLFVRDAIGLLLFYKCMPEFIWIYCHLNRISQQYLTCEYPF